MTAQAIGKTKKRVWFSCIGPQPDWGVITPRISARAQEQILFMTDTEKCKGVLVEFEFRDAGNNYTEQSFKLPGATLDAVESMLLDLEEDGFDALFNYFTTLWKQDRESH